MFTCNNWLSTTKGYKTLRISLSPSCYAHCPDSSDLLRRNLSQRFFDDHMWLSVGFRDKKSCFTRAQRLGACMATLFLAMISNCMFYNDASEETTAAAALFQIGSISITVAQLYNSFMSSLIVLPPVLFITVFFSKLAPSASEKNQAKSNNNNNNTANRRPKAYWPHWCVYVAWTLVVVAILVSALFTVLYSMQWGKDKSEHWLQAFVLSFLSLQYSYNQ